MCPMRAYAQPLPLYSRHTAPSQRCMSWRWVGDRWRHEQVAEAVPIAQILPLSATQHKATVEAQQAQPCRIEVHRTGCATHQPCTPHCTNSPA
jgi:hypothetical protein